MNGIARGRTNRMAALAALVVLLSLLGGPGLASANKGGTTTYDYKVTKFDFLATGQLDAGRIKSVCTPFVDSIWTGSVKTSDAELSELSLGTGDLKIGKHGTSGVIDAKTESESTFKAFYSEVTACDEFGAPTSYQNMDCADSQDHDMTAFLSIDGGVGDKVTVESDLVLADSASVVPNGFACAEPFAFPTAKCKAAKLPLSVFTAKNVELSVKCRGEAMQPPVANNYTQYGATVRASATVDLHRTKQH